MAQVLGAGVLTVHPAGERQNVPRARRISPGSTTILRRSARPPLRIRSQLRIENMEPAVNSLICTPERMREVLDAEPWLMFTLDTSHALASSEETVMQYIDLCADRLANVHISRAGNGRLHLPLDRNPVIARILGIAP